MDKSKKNTDVKDRFEYIYIYIYSFVYDIRSLLTFSDSHIFHTWGVGGQGEALESERGDDQYHRIRSPIGIWEGVL